MKQRNIEKDYGEIIYVKINGHPYKTYLDNNGSQRFVPNKVVEAFVDYGKDFTLNDLRRLVDVDAISYEDFLEFYTMFNDTVDGFYSAVVDGYLYRNAIDSMPDANNATDEQIDAYVAKYIDKYFYMDNPLWNNI